MPIPHSSTEKVHLAARPETLVQRCARCGARICGPSSGPFWPTGAPVLSRRTGMRRLTEGQAAAFRPCGSPCWAAAGPISPQPDRETLTQLETEVA